MTVEPGAAFLVDPGSGISFISSFPSFHDLIFSWFSLFVFFYFLSFFLPEYVSIYHLGKAYIRLPLLFSCLHVLFTVRPSVAPSPQPTRINRQVVTSPFLPASPLSSPTHPVHLRYPPIHPPHPLQPQQTGLSNSFEDSVEAQKIRNVFLEDSKKCAFHKR